MKKVYIVLLIFPLFFSCNDVKSGFLVGVTEELNKDCPVFVDDGITLINCSSSDNFVIYNYELDTENYDFNFRDEEDYQAELNLYCTDPDFDEFRLFDVGIIRVFKDKKGSVIQEFKLQKSDC